MSYPPPPGGPPPGNPGPPQGYSGPYGPPPQQPPWQQQWPPGPPPKKRGNVWKWLLGGVALLAVIGVTVAVTVSVTSDSGDGDDPAPSGETFGLASADDKGPANIITEDPSCAAWGPINQTFVDVQKTGWNNRDASIPASDWSSEQRAAYERVADAAREAADQTVTLARLTPHRVMRELYEQFIAYARAYSDAVPAYTPADDHLAGVTVTTSMVLVYLCSAISSGSAEARVPLIEVPPPPRKFARISDPNNSQIFMMEVDSTCGEWERLLNKFNADTKAWQAVDTNTPVSAWTTEHRAAAESVVPVMNKFADDIYELGEKSSNPTLQDFAVMAAQYRRAFAQALPTYTPSDVYLDSASYRTTSIIYEACKAAEA
ncbi:hypothetical protein H7I77_06180 [Mycolicibacterium novocastrense]|uniref:DUF3829 domain-containing protein n=1 Tax=Mycolicibacterium novocastrense TaxID=59813 RepID=A0AAW5SH69_MYCNV|nr:hypothetical protein [Mycolicibacterium novocastrense]GAT10972.1 uncharacterized protein RMCN_4105 [Mycolicibacterium novocastrense]